MSSPRPVRVLPYIWHRDDGTDELTISLTGSFSKRIIIPARQLREIADALHDRADESEDPKINDQETTMTTTTFTEEQYDKLMIRAMAEERRTRDAETQIEQHTARIGYLEHLLSIREEQLTELGGLVKEAVAK